VALLSIGGYSLEFADPSDDGVLSEEAPPGQGPQATIQFQCPWEGRYSVFAGLVGTASGGPGAIYRQPPLQYPPSPNLYCLGVGNARPWGRYQGGWVWEYCRFTATFGIPSYSWEAQPEGVTDPSGQAYTTTRFRVSADVTQVPLGTFVWTSGTDSGKPVPDAQLGIMVPHTEVTITRHLMPFVPLAEAASYVGKVNTSAVSIGNHSFTAGQFLFAGMSGSASADTAGTRNFEVEYTLLGAHGHTWNQLLDRGLAWVTINTAAGGGGNSPFGSADYWTALP
jgi:hypothetical protein